MLSVANFLTLVLLARSIDPKEFGVFSPVYGAMLIANYVELAFITQPTTFLLLPCAVRTTVFTRGPC